MTSASELQAPQRLRVWCAEVPVQFDSALERDYLALLSEPEHQQLAKLRLEALKRRYLLTRVLVRTALSRCVARAFIAPEAWTFAYNAYGRPSIADPPPAARRLRFNISHTEALVVLVVAHEREVGIDVECTSRDAPLDVARHFFSRREAFDLGRLPPAQQAARFWDLWTLKESYIKARGMGLSLPLDAFTFSFDGARLALAVEPRLADPGSGWHFWQFALPGEHLLALCAQRLGRHAAPDCDFCMLLPLRDERPLAPGPHLRATG